MFSNHPSVNQALKFGAMVLQNLPEMPSDIMQNWIENPKELQRFLAGLVTLANSSPNFKVWKTISLGTGLINSDNFPKSIKDSGMRIGDWAIDILGKLAFTVTKKETEVDLVVVTVEELGFKEGATLKEIYERAQQCGLKLCPSEVGPQLRLQYKDQPKDECLVIGMEPITDSDGNRCLFDLAHNEGYLWLHVHYGKPSNVCRINNKFVFVLPRK